MTAAELKRFPYQQEDMQMMLAQYYGDVQVQGIPAGGLRRAGAGSHPYELDVRH